MSRATSNPTIFAPASAPGRAGVAVLRVSGPDALESMKTLTGNAAPPDRQATLKTLKNPAGNVIDRAIVVTYKSPASFTGEDVVEYHLHGGPAIMRMMLDALSQQKNHRMAEPGEFTRRAFENDKMDLTAAEAVADLINAETEFQQQQALAQMGGALSALYEGWAARLAQSLAHLEADLDFPDEDIPDGVRDRVIPVISALYNEISDHLDDNRRGERLRDGFQVVVIGPPNAGKSSLVNALAQRDIAIVSALAGTTRDVLEAHLNLGGYPVILVDTAGLRPDQLSNSGHDAIESEGIRRAIARAKSADIRILLFDAALEPDPQTLALSDENALIVLNKSDQNKGFTIAGAISISVKNNTGLDALNTAIIDKIKNIAGSYTTPSLTRERHRNALEDCRFSLDQARHAPLPELMAEDVRLAIRALGRITGRVDVEDLLDIIFRDFCIGK